MNLASEFMTSTIDTLTVNKRLADRAVAQVSDEDLHRALDEQTNSIAIIMKHVAGNLRSRWTDVLTTDGEKPWRHRDQEFIDTDRSRRKVLDDWESGWNCLFDALNALTDDDLSKTVFIRGEPHSVPLAIQRSLGHSCYHIGQIIHIARIHAGDHWQTLTIPPGGSEQFNQENWGRSGKSHS